MQLGMIGLGRMGGNMVRRLLAAGHQLVVYDRNPDAVEASVKDGAVGTTSIEGLVDALAPPRAVWVMVPAGGPTESTIAELALVLAAGDTIVDGGNSHYKDDVRRAALLGAKGLHYLDVGTSGGVWGAARGYSLMIGGPGEAVRQLEPVFASLAPGDDGTAKTPGREGGTAERGYLHCGPAGAGHFVKMVHNGIEYGLMQAYAEGFDLLRHAGHLEGATGTPYAFDLADIAEVWRHGSVVGSWLLDLTATALAADPHLEHYSGFVQDSGEGRWTIDAAVEAAVPVNVLAASLFARFRSRQDHTFGERVLSAMRHQFGGHTEPPSGSPSETPSPSQSESPSESQS